MSKDFFSAWFTAQSFFRLKTWIAGLQYLLARVVFNAFPLPQEMAGVKRALEYSAGLIERSLALLVYPEGRRTEDGKIHGFQPGIGLMAVRLQVPVIPVYIEGLYQVYSVHHSWPKPGTVRVVFGEPLRFPAHTTYEAAAHTVEAAVHRLRG